MVVYLAMGVAAHGASHAGSHTVAASGPGATGKLCLKTPAGQPALLVHSNTAPAEQPGQGPECTSLHCLFHHAFCDQSQTGDKRFSRHTFQWQPEAALTSLSPASPDKPPRLIS